MVPDALVSFTKLLIIFFHNIGGVLSSTLEESFDRNSKINRCSFGIKYQPFMWRRWESNQLREKDGEGQKQI
jgi:hypothetical protein